MKNATSTDRNAKWKADFRAMLGDRMTNRFMAACDLGIEGAYQPHTVTITWKRGLVLTTARAKKLCQSIKDGFNNTECGVDCASVEFLRVYKV